LNFNPLFILPEEITERDIIDRLGDEFPVYKESSTTENLTFFDTFDWRLYNKSLVLYLSSDNLYLRKLGQAEILSGVVVADQPVFVWDLPKGDLKAKITPIIEMRAMLKLIDLQIQSFPYRVLDQNEKTVVWMVIEDLRSPQVDDKVWMASYVRLAPVRGYPKRQLKLADRLMQLGLSPVDEEDYYLRALVASGKVVGDYSSKLDIVLTPEMPAVEAAKTILLFLLGVMKANEAGIRADIDSEYLHDFRVAIRRTRSALSLIKAVFLPAITEKYKCDFARLGKFSNNLRDLDVYLLSEDTYRSMLPESIRTDISPLFEYLSAQRGQALNEVIATLNSPEYTEIIENWSAFLNDSDLDLSSPPNAAVPVIDLARKQIYKHYRKVIKNGSDILDDPQDEHLHALRIECKKLRYLIEFFASLFAEKQIAICITELKALQDNLGDFNDLCVQQEYLLRIADDFPISEPNTRRTLVAVGSLVDNLAKQQESVKAAFKQTFLAFASLENQKRYRQLFGINK